MKLGHGGENFLFPKDDMLRNAKSFGEWIPTPIAFVFNPITQEAAAPARAHYYLSGPILSRTTSL